MSLPAGVMAHVDTSLGGAGMSRSTTNTYAVLALAVVLVFTCLGQAVDVGRSKPQDQKQGSRLRFWVLGMLVSSYALLVPGLTMTLIDFELSATFFGFTMPLATKSETTLQLVRTTSEEGAYVAATCLTVYAVVIPALKLFLLFLGLAWQQGSPRKVRWARRAIVVVQVVSKWASPDMFAYIVMMCLFRGLNKPPQLSSDLQLGLGFSCFGIFCLGSTISSLGLCLPGPSAEVRETSKSATPHGMGRCAFAAVAALACASAVLLGIGMGLPCMELRFDMDLLYKNNPDLVAFKSVIDTLGLSELLHREVSVWECLELLRVAILDGEVNSALAFIMFGCCAVCLPFLDTFLLFFAASGMHFGLAADVLKVVMATTRVTRKLSMLDVCVMGIVIVVLSLQSFRDKGILLSMRWGVVALAWAEFCRYSMSFLVHGAYRQSYSSGAKEVTDDEQSPESQV